MSPPNLYVVRTGRNYAADMTAELARARDPSGWINAVRAQELIDDLEANDPDLLNGWMRTLAIPVIAKLIASGEGLHVIEGDARA